jgi:3-oxoacyl-[acyl-carrier protein] reductase
MWDNQVARQAEAGSQYFAADPQAVGEQMLAAIPLRRYGSPDEVADVVCYLAGDRSSYLTGVNIEAAGGAL